MFASLIKFVSKQCRSLTQSAQSNSCMALQLSCSWQEREDEKVEEVYADQEMQNLSAIEKSSPLKKKNSSTQRLADRDRHRLQHDGLIVFHS